MELTRTYTVDQLEALGLPWDHVIARDNRVAHLWYANWRIIFRDPADGTTWSIIRSENMNDSHKIHWWKSYGDRNEIVAHRVKSRQITVTAWFEVGALEGDTEAADA